jgi:hypothetical protein
MIGKMFRLAFATATILTALSLMSCGTSSHDSREQTRTGVTPSGYPGGQAKDAESPALASSTETAHSNPIPKVPESEEHHEPATHEKK